MTRQKQIDVTTDMLAQIERVTGTSLNASDIVVYEAAALSTRALSKPGSIYHGAIPSRQMLLDMADALNSGRESVPLHTNHMQGLEMPLGRVFHATVLDEPDGSSVLVAQFYLPRSEADLIEKINLAVLDEVSVGVKSKAALCSKCGFDFFGEEADFTHLFAQTCGNDHTIGVDGMHLKLTGLDRWMELSLVSRGASSKPKILSRVKGLLPQDQYDRMAADGTPAELSVLFTSAVTGNTEMTEEMKAALEALDAKLDAALAPITALTARVEELAAAAEAPEADDDAGEEETAAQLTAVQAELEAAQARIAELEAAAETSAEVNDEDDAGQNQQQQIQPPAGGLAASAESTGTPKLDASAFRSGSFKTKRNR